MRFNGANSQFNRVSFPTTTLYTTTQLRLDSHAESFSREASNLSSLLALSAAGVSYQVGRSATWALFSNTPSRLMPRVLAPLVGLNFEVATLHASHQLANANIATERGEGYRSYFSTLIDIASLKGIGFMGGSFATPTRHVMQSVGMASAHRFASAIGLTPQTSSPDFLREVFDAEMVNIEMEAGGHLAQRLGGHHLTQAERALETRGRLLEHANVEAVPEQMPILSSNEIVAWERTLEPSSLSDFLNARKWSPLEVLWRNFRLWRFERNLSKLSPDERFAGISRIVASLADRKLNTPHADFLFEALKRSYGQLSSDQVRNCAEISLRLLQEPNIDPTYNVRWLLVLRDVAPRLPSTFALEVLQEVMKSIVSPFPEVSKVAFDFCFKPLKMRLGRADLLSFARFLSSRSLEFQPVQAMDKVTKVFEEVFDRLPILRASMDKQQACLEEARVAAGYLSHDVFSLAALGQARLFSLLREVPESEARSILPDQLSENVSTNLRWVEEYERLRNHPDPSTPQWLRMWSVERSGLILQSLTQSLSILSMPREWNDLRVAASRVENLEDLLAFTTLLRSRFASEDSNTQVIARTWFENSNSTERNRVLQILMGSREFWKLKGRHALRLRNLVLEGIPGEVGIASKNPEVQDNDDVIFVMGDRTSVSMPLGFVEEYSMQEALQYLMVHHTHPRQAGNDLNQIYPSTHLEGSGSGDLYALLTLFNKLRPSAPLAFSQTHYHGGSMFVISEKGGKKRLDIYTGLRGQEGHSMEEALLSDVRGRIHRWAQRNNLEHTFWEVPWEYVENMNYPGRRNSPHPVDESRIRPLRN